MMPVSQGLAQSQSAATSPTYVLAIIIRNRGEMTVIHAASQDLIMVNDSGWSGILRMDREYQTGRKWWAGRGWFCDNVGRTRR
jgi:hypothetical protein